MSAFILTMEAIQQIKAMIAYGLANPATAETMEKRHEAGKAPGDDPRCHVILPGGFKLVYSCDLSPSRQPYHHFSFSCTTPHRVPAPEAFFICLEAADMVTPSPGDPDCHCWMEKITESFTAVNIAFPVNPKCKSPENESTESTLAATSPMPSAGPCACGETSPSIPNESSTPSESPSIPT